MKKVLHLSNWYPNKWDDLEGVFIKEQFDVFSRVTESTILNIQVRVGGKLLRYEYVRYSDTEEGYYFFTSIQSHKIIELLTTILLLYALYKSKYKKYDILHFHIAYPLLTYYSIWKKIITLPILISEHWSAYHFNFYMPWNTKKLDRIKCIFKQKIPLITVSNTLLKDIQKFSNVNDFSSMVIPNVIDQTTFFYEKKATTNEIPTFFAVNNWRKIKNPFPMLEGFASVYREELDFKLIIGGYGEELDAMKAYILKEGFYQKVTFLGKMSKQEITHMLRESDAYLFSSTYETFSVVCAQALCCGVPLIGPKLEAINEYADIDSFLSLSSNDSKKWATILYKFIETREAYDRKLIAMKAHEYLSSDIIEKQYKNSLDDWFGTDA